MQFTDTICVFLITPHILQIVYLHNQPLQNYKD